MERIMLNAKDALQLEKNALLAQIRHLANLHTCPSYISVQELKDFIVVLKGEKIEHISSE